MSHAMLPVDYVEKAASLFLQLRDARIQKLDRDDIKRRVVESAPGFIAKVFGFKPLTYEQAEYQYNDSLTKQFTHAEGKLYASEAKKLLILAKHAKRNGVKSIALSANIATAFEKMGAFPSSIEET